MSDATGRFKAWSLPRDVSTGPGMASGAIQSLDPPPELVATWLAGLESHRAAHPVPLEARIQGLGRIGARFMDKGSATRQQALEFLPSTSGLSSEMAEHVLDEMAKTWTVEALRRVVGSEFPNPSVFDSFVSGSEGARVVPLTPQLHVGSGNVPGVTLTSAIRGLMVGAAVLAKPGAGDAVLTVLGRQILQEEVPDLAGSLGVAHWPGRPETLTLAYRSAAVAVVYGDDATVEVHRAVAPAALRLVEYPHRASAALIDSSKLDQETARQLAYAVAAYDRRGCVSPQVGLVILATETARAWSRLLEWGAEVARCLEALEEKLPSGVRSEQDAARYPQVLGDLELLRAAGQPIELWTGEGATWTVVANATGGTVPLPSGRSIQLRPLPSLERAVEELAGWGSRLQTVGVSVAAQDREAVLERLADAGALRLSTLEGMAWPPAWWLHDGRGALGPLVARVQRD